MGIKLIELKVEPNADYQDFIFKESVSEQILNWNLLDINSVKEYINKNPFPKDKYLTKEEFLLNLSSDCYMEVRVEKEKTAEYIAELIYEVV